MILSTLILPKSGINNDSYPYIKIQTANGLRLKFENLEGNLCLHMYKHSFEKFISNEDEKEYWVDVNSLMKAEGMEPELEEILLVKDKYSIDTERLNIFKTVIKGEECSHIFFIDLINKKNKVLKRIYLDNIYCRRVEGYKVRVTLE